jgi:hypothetical protein
MISVLPTSNTLFDYFLSWDSSLTSLTILLGDENLFCSRQCKLYQHRNDRIAATCLQGMTSSQSVNSFESSKVDPANTSEILLLIFNLGSICTCIGGCLNIDGHYEDKRMHHIAHATKKIAWYGTDGEKFREALLAGERTFKVHNLSWKNVADNLWHIGTSRHLAFIEHVTQGDSMKAQQILQFLARA